MMIPDFILRFLGKEAAKKLNIKETQMADSSTPWYQNKSTLGHIFTALVGVYLSAKGIALADFGHSIPAIPAWLLTVAAAFGVYENHA